MRIDGLSNIAASNSSNIADMLGRLDTGDVIKAKVIESKSGEVVLRLFDGSVLKAATGENLEAKVGQTLTLSVTSKAEGTIFLETVKDSSQLSNMKPQILKNMLEALQIKPDSRNMALAAEFMKTGITVTSSLTDKAAGLMESFKGLNAEKAAFIASKDLQTDQIKLESLTKLLDGNIKVGELLKELQTALENISKTVGKTSLDAAMTKAIYEAVEAALTSNTATSASPATASNSSSASTVTLASTSSTASNAAIISNASVITDAAQTSSTLTSTLTSTLASTLTTTATPATPASAASVASTATESATQQGTSINNTLADVQTYPTLNKADSNSSVAIVYGLDVAVNTTSKESTLLNQPVATGVSENTSGQQGAAAASAKVTELENPTTSTSASPSTLATNSNVSAASSEDQSIIIDVSNKADFSATDPLSKLKDIIKDLFVNINSDKLASELDVDKLHKDLNSKLDILKAAINTANLADLSDGKSIAATTQLLDDSAKLLNQLNNNNLLYYQLPVNLSGYNTTAELFIMKRQQSKKKVDPHNTVVFVALDTNNLGRIETLLDVKGNNVSINLRSEKQQINEFVKENIKYLYNGLVDCGYKLVDIKYALINFATPPVKLEQLLSKMVDSNHSKVDMRI